MKIKLDESHKADWRYYGCGEFNPHYGTYITHRESKKYGYRLTILSYNDAFYITQSLYNLTDRIEHVSVHKIKSVNDGKAMLEVMLQFIKNYRRKDPHTKRNLPSNTAITVGDTNA